MKKLTFRAVLEVDQVVGRLYKKDENLKNTKFGYAYSRYYQKNYTPLVEEFKSGMQHIYINNALEDDRTKELLVDKENPRGFKYSKAGLLKCLEEEAKFEKEFYDKEVEIKPFISSLIPEGLSDEDKELLTGVVI